MAIDRTGISSLDTGASDITYSGDEGPKSPDQMLMASADPMLVEEYNKYVFEMEEQGQTPISFREFVEQVMSGMAEGGIARLGYRGGQLVKPGPGRPGYQGSRWDDPGSSPGTSYTGGGGGGGPPGGGDPGMTYTAPAPVSHHPKASPGAVVAAAQAQAAEVAAAADEEPGSERTIPGATGSPYLLNRPTDTPIGMPQEPPGGGDPDMYWIGDTGGADITVPGDDQYQKISSTPIGEYEDDRILRIRSGQEPGYRAQDERPYGFQDIEAAYRAGAATKDEFDKYIDADPVLTLDRGLDTTGGLGGVGTGGVGTGGVGTGGTGTNVPGTPIVPEGITAAESAQAFEEAKAAEIAKVQAAAAASGAPFKDYYVGGDPTTEQEKFMEEAGAAASMVGREAWPAAYGGRVPAAFGGIMDSATGRRAYGLGSVFKKAAKAVKKIVKSPIGKAALIGALGFGIPSTSFSGMLGAGKGAGWKKFLLGAPGVMSTTPWGEESVGPGVSGLLSRLKLTQGEGSMMPTAFGGILAASAAPFLFQGKGEDEPSWAGDYGEGLDLLGIRKKILAKKGTREEFPYLNPDYYATAADGGRIGYDNGGLSEDDLLGVLVKKLMSQGMSPEEAREEAIRIIQGKAQGGRIGYQDGRSVRSIALNQLYGIAPKRKVAQEGGLMDLGGMEKDYREEGGFVPIGGQERADDVPARLSKNEFVFTADAVRSAGGGDIDKGAEVMENVMNNLEQGGQVSEESQGLEGARNMFATAQRLEGVL